MINKIIHFSDLHIRLLKDHNLYKEILTDMLNQFRKIKPNRIVFTGDLVHSKNVVSPELIEFIVWLLNECSSIAKTILIFGNHDGLVNNEDRIDALTPIISTLNNPNIIYYKDRGTYEDENVTWCVYSQYQGNIPPDITNAKGIKIGLFHGPINGLKTDLGYSFGDEAYDTNKFDGLDIVLCGDIHKRAEFNIPNNKKGYMIGSTIQQGYGESIDKHGYGILDLKTMKYDTVDLFNYRPYLSFRITSYDDIINENEKLINL